MPRYSSRTSSKNRRDALNPAHPPDDVDVDGYVDRFNQEDAWVRQRRNIMKYKH